MAGRPPPPLPPSANAGQAPSDNDDFERFAEFVRRGDLAHVEGALKESPAYATVQGNLGNTGAHWAASSGHDAVLEALIAAGAPINAQNSVGDTPLHLAAWRSRLNCASLLLQNGADRTVVNKDGKTAAELVRDEELEAVLPKFDAAQIASMIEIADSDDESD